VRVRAASHRERAMVNVKVMVRVRGKKKEGRTHYLSWHTNRAVSP
jgi:hypothetical protein